VKLQNPRIVWVSFFAIVNLVCGVVIFETRDLLGETSALGLKDTATVPWATFLVISSYIVLLLCVFPVLSKLKIKRIRFSPHDLGDTVGILLMLLQFGYIAFFITTGTGVAGSNNRTDSIMSPVWVMISCDSLLFIYYGFYRHSRLFVPNLLIGIVSTLLRGWSGFFIVILFMESARLMRAGKVKYRHIFLVLVAAVVIYPAVWLFKWEARSFLLEGFTGSSFTGLWAGILAYVDTSGYFEIIKDSFLGTFVRLHLVSNLIAISEYSRHFALRIEDGTIDPFWREGPLGLVCDRILGIRTGTLGNALADVLDPWHEDNWVSNPSYAGWFFISPLLTPLYLAYTLFLGWISVFLVKKLNGDTASLDMLWFAWCYFLLPGWIASFVLFTFSLGTFCLLHFVAAELLRWKSVFSSNAGLSTS
jgi:hypothetical protein